MFATVVWARVCILDARAASSDEREKDGEEEKAERRLEETKVLALILCLLVFMASSNRFGPPSELLLATCAA